MFGHKAWPWEISNLESKICHSNLASEARIHPAAFPHAVAELCHPGAIPDTESEDTVHVE